jgi:hypothetical protein
MLIKLKKMYKNLMILFSAVVAFALTGCDKMDDTQKIFTEGGELTYPAKADSLKATGGLNRLELSWLMFADPKVDSYKIYWNNRKDSIVNKVQKTEEVDTIRVMLKNLAESTYHFEVYTYDKFGHSSVKAMASGKVYGDRYIASLLPKAYRLLTRKGLDLHIDWMGSDPQLIYAELSYTNRSGVLEEVKILGKDEVTKLESFPVKGVFELRSVFVPEANALDTFYTEYQKITVP